MLVYSSSALKSGIETQFHSGSQGILESLVCLGVLVFLVLLVPLENRGNLTD